MLDILRLIVCFDLVTLFPPRKWWESESGWWSHQLDCAFRAHKTVDAQWRVFVQRMDHVRSCEIFLHENLSCKVEPSPNPLDEKSESRVSEKKHEVKKRKYVFPSKIRSLFLFENVMSNRAPQPSTREIFV